MAMDLFELRMGGIDLLAIFGLSPDNYVNGHGLDRTRLEKDLRGRHRQLMKELHPEAAAGFPQRLKDEGGDLFTQVQEAYATLADLKSYRINDRAADYIAGIHRSPQRKAHELAERVDRFTKLREGFQEIVKSRGDALRQIGDLERDLRLTKRELSQEKERRKDLAGSEADRKRYEAATIEAKRQVQAAEARANQYQKEAAAYKGRVGELEKRVTETQRAGEALLKKAQPQQPDPLTQRIMITVSTYIARGAYADAQKLTDVLLAFAPSAQAQHLAAQVQQGQGDLERAAEHHTAALNIDPKYAPAQTSLKQMKTEIAVQVKTLRDQGKATEAIALGERLLKIDPTNSDAKYYLGTIAMGQKRYTQAEHYFSELPTHSSARACLERIKEIRKN